MTDKPIALACDHAGFPMKEFAKSVIADMGYQTLDLGCYSTESVDYPDYGIAMGKAIESGDADMGVLVCGSGIGISIAANRNPAVRAAVVQDGLTARLSRQHNNANVIALGGRLIGEEQARDCIKEFFQTKFEGGRHARRVEIMS